MAEFVKKTMMGYKEVELGYNDSECTHVILSLEEYDSLHKRIHTAEQESRRKIQEAESKAFERIKNAEWDRNYTVSQKEQEVEALKESLEKKTREAEYRKRLNSNLIRITQERANSQRDLRPKKEHTGYVVKRSSEREHRYKDGRSMKSLVLWETVLQTPYSVEYSSEDAAKLIDELFAGEETDRKGLIVDLGIQRIFFTVEGYHDALKANNAPTDNTVVDRRLSANYRTGFWEIQLLHTQALNVVPWDWREPSDK